jgi:hypothetical protein
VECGEVRRTAGRRDIKNASNGRSRLAKLSRVYHIIGNCQEIYHKQLVFMGIAEKVRDTAVWVRGLFVNRRFEEVKR